MGQGEGRQPEYGEALMLPGQDVLSEVDLVYHGEQQLQELAATVSSSAGSEVAASPCKVAGTYEDTGCPLGPRCQRTKATVYWRMLESVWSMCLPISAWFPGSRTGPSTSKEQKIVHCVGALVGVELGEIVGEP